jgi:RNA polymerase sigma-70 factor, ECF subfamily
VDIHNLVTLARTGDKEAFGKLYDSFLDTIYRFVYFRVGSRVEAEDITEQIFVSVFDHITTYEERKIPFEAWLYRIARNKIIDYYRTKKPKINLEEISDRPDEKPGPEKTAEIQLTKEIVMNALDKLPDIYREIIILKYIEEKENKEIEIILNTGSGHVRVLQQRALSKLRTILKL